MTKKNIKTVCYVSLFAFVIFQFFDLEFLDAIGYSVSLAAAFDVVYDRWLWRFNPLEDTPRIFGVYDALFISNYNGRTDHPSVITIKQTLTEISISERAHDGRSIAVVAKLVKSPVKGDPWNLHYIYETKPDPNDHNDAHQGTVLLCIRDRGNMEGSYYTNRIQPTKGKLILRLRKYPDVPNPIDAHQFN